MFLFLFHYPIALTYAKSRAQVLVWYCHCPRLFLSPLYSWLVDLTDVQSLFCWYYWYSLLSWYSQCLNLSNLNTVVNTIALHLYLTMDWAPAVLLIWDGMDFRNVINELANFITLFWFICEVNLQHCREVPTPSAAGKTEADGHLPMYLHIQICRAEDNEKFAPFASTSMLF